MFIGGKHIENTTCPVCKYRHPESFSCAQASALAQIERRIREEFHVKTPTTAAQEPDPLTEMLAWAYGKLYDREFRDQEDCLMLDGLKLYLEHGVLG